MNNTSKYKLSDQNTRPVFYRDPTFSSFENIDHFSDILEHLPNVRLKWPANKENDKNVTLWIINKLDTFINTALGQIFRQDIS